MYAVIQLPVMYFLYKVKSHFVITGLIFINMLYNLATPLSYFDARFIDVYYAKDWFVGSIMVMELIYLGLLSQYVRSYITKRWNVNNDYIDSVFRVRGWNPNGGLA